MCFTPQRRALFRHLNLQKCSEPVSFLHFATVCTFLTSQLPKVVRSLSLSSSLLFSSLTLPTSAFHLSILSEVWLLNFLRLCDYIICVFSTTDPKWGLHIQVQIPCDWRPGCLAMWWSGRVTSPRHRAGSSSSWDVYHLPTGGISNHPPYARIQISDTLAKYQHALLLNNEIIAEIITEINIEINNEINNEITQNFQSAKETSTCKESACVTVKYHLDFFIELISSYINMF